MIRNIVFDFGKVLVDYSFPQFLSTFIKDEQQMLQFSSVLCSRVVVDRFDRGALSFHEIIEETRAEHPQWSSYLDEFERRQLEAVTNEVPGMRSLILRLREKGYALYGLTNWSETVYPVIEKFGILRMLDGRVVSSEEKIIKPDVAIYHRLCEKYGLKEEECFFVDDKPINVEGAIAAGMEAVVFIGAEQLEREMVSREIL